MTTRFTGDQAEDAAAQYLKAHGYEVIARNWRTRYCEIDIVARQKKTVYFAEVKYRQSGRQGTGLDYITPRKLRQMQFAAELWVAEHDWRGEYCLAAVEVTGDSFAVTGFVPNCQ